MVDDIETEEKKEECPRCEMNVKMIGMTLAHISCSTIKDENERGECNEWAAGINPTEMTMEEMAEGAYDRAGIAGLSALPEMYNEMIRGLVIKKVGDKLERGEQITEEENNLYHKYTKKEIAKGL